MATLNDLTTVIKTELGLFDTTSVALIEAYLSLAYQNIWGRYPWGDANGYGYAQLQPGIAIADYPAGMDRIITVRATTGVTTDAPAVPDSPITEEPAAPPLQSSFNSWFLDPVDSTFLIESYPTIYETRGSVKYYEEIGDASGRQIRVYPIPNRGTNLFFYGKMQCPGFSASTDTALLRNIDPALLAYATADMLKRQRQYGKADLRRKEAQELEAVAWNLEQQQVNKPRRTKATTVAGNSLAEMTDAVCMICGQWTPEYRLIIREFLRRNYQALYDSYLWQESIVNVGVPFTSEQVILPEYIDRVIGVRGGPIFGPEHGVREGSAARMSQADVGLILDTNPDVWSYNTFGEPVTYTTLTPVGVATLPVTTTKLVLASTSPLDVGEMILRGEVLSNGTQVEEPVVLQGTTPVTTYWSYDIPLTVAKEVTAGFVTVNAQSDGRLLVQLLPYQREQKHQRLWFLPRPDPARLQNGDQFYCLILGKRTIRPLLGDEDTPIITGVQQVLIAAAAADVFQKLGQMDQANAMKQKADGSMNVLKDKNNDQAANSPRFVPQVEPRAYVAGGCSTW